MLCPWVLSHRHSFSFKIHHETTEWMQPVIPSWIFYIRKFSPGCEQNSFCILSYWRTYLSYFQFVPRISFSIASQKLRTSFFVYNNCIEIIKAANHYYYTTKRNHYQTCKYRSTWIFQYLFYPCKNYNSANSCYKRKLCTPFCLSITLNNHLIQFEQSFLLS